MKSLTVAERKELQALRNDLEQADANRKYASSVYLQTLTRFKEHVTKLAKKSNFTENHLRQISKHSRVAAVTAFIKDHPKELDAGDQALLKKIAALIDKVNKIEGGQQ